MICCISLGRLWDGLTKARTTLIGGANADYAVLTDLGWFTPDPLGRHVALCDCADGCGGAGQWPAPGRWAVRRFLRPGRLPAAGLRAAVLGCEGKWAIHPSQIALANDVIRLRKPMWNWPSGFWSPWSRPQARQGRRFAYARLYRLCLNPPGGSAGAKGGPDRQTQ